MTMQRATIRRLRILGAAMMAIGLFPVAATTAASTDAAGWWSRTGSPLPVNPAAPHVEEGQLHVQGEPAGPTAIAAVRWTLSEGESAPMLTITPADSSFVPPEAVITACRAAGPWQEAHGGPWDEAPEADCATSVDGVIAEDGTSIEFALAPLLDGTTLDVVLQPGKREDGAGSTFSLTFDRPAPDALTTTSSSSSGDFSSGDFSGGSTDSSGVSESPGFSSSPAAGGGNSGSFSAPSSSGSSFAAPSAELPEAPPLEEPALDAETGAPGGSELAAAAPARSSGAGSDRAKNLGLVVLVAGAAVLGWAWMASARAESVATRRAVTA